MSVYRAQIAGPRWPEPRSPRARAGRDRQGRAFTISASDMRARFERCRSADSRVRRGSGLADVTGKARCPSTRACDDRCRPSQAGPAASGAHSYVMGRRSMRSAERLRKGLERGSEARRTRAPQAGRLRAARRTCGGTARPGPEAFCGGGERFLDNSRAAWRPAHVDRCSVSVRRLAVSVVGGES